MTDLLCNLNFPSWEMEKKQKFFRGQSLLQKACSMRLALWNCSCPSVCLLLSCSSCCPPLSAWSPSWSLFIRCQDLGMHARVCVLVAFIDYNFFISLTDCSKLYHLLVHELSFDIPLLSKILIFLVSSLLFITLCLLLLLALELYF